ncbi:MAG TPA: PilT/PilU family type 4a pilus ATPase [Blastocatellia bacterium]|jgi:twitching motility protein PilT|nr:PilT/PilU family type 4a pilus ATPase [Blastocatellia bacterium]
MSTINFSQVIQQMLSVSNKISDLIFSPGRPPQVELIGKLTAVNLPGMEMLTPAHTAGIAKALIGTNKAAEDSLETNGSADLSFSLPGLSRFRVNIFKQRGTHAIVMRVVPDEIPSFEDLGIPVILKEVADLKNGIVLVTGPTGSGKSSTLAAIIDLINDTKYYHIVTIEDPIEFMHRHKKCTVHQRELHSDTPNFAYALRAALRQAPKVILVGEIRDLETVEVALEASETGHLVLSTLHTTDAVKTVERLIGLFPKSQEHIIRLRLSGAFRYIVSQRLIPRADGRGRIAAVEILKSTARTREYIEKGEKEGKSLYDAMRDGNLEGMQLFDMELERLIRLGTITLNDGMAYSTNRQNLLLSLSDFGGGDAGGFVKPEAPRNEFIA